MSQGASWTLSLHLPLKSVKLHQCTVPAAQWGIRSNKSHLLAALATGDHVLMTLWTGLQSQLLTSTQTSRRIINNPTSALFPLPTFAKEYQNKHTHTFWVCLQFKSCLTSFLNTSMRPKAVTQTIITLTFKSYITLDFWWSLEQSSIHQGMELKPILRWKKKEEGKVNQYW